MKITNITGDIAGLCDIFFSVENGDGSCKSITLKPGQFVFTETDNRTKTLLMHERRKSVLVEDIKQDSQDSANILPNALLNTVYEIKNNSIVVATNEPDNIVVNKVEVIREKKREGGTKPKGAKNKYELVPVKKKKSKIKYQKVSKANNDN